MYHTYKVDCRNASVGVCTCRSLTQVVFLLFGPIMNLINRQRAEVGTGILINLTYEYGEGLFGGEGSSLSHTDCQVQCSPASGP